MAARPSGVCCGCRGASGDAPNWQSAAWNARRAYSCAAGHPGPRRRRDYRTRERVLRLLGYMRIKRVGGLRLYPVAPGTGNEARGGHLAGDGPQRDTVRRGHRRCDRPSGCDWRVSPSLVRCGILAGGTVLVLLSVSMPVLTPVCRRPLWRRMHCTLHALAGHDVRSDGRLSRALRARRPVPPDRVYRRVLVLPAAGQASQAVVFRISRRAGGRLAVHASLRDGRTPAAWPVQAVHVPNLLDASQPGSAARRHIGQEGSLRTEGRPMRFQIVPDSQARPLASHRLARAPAGDRAAAAGLWRRPAD